MCLSVQLFIVFWCSVWIYVCIFAILSDRCWDMHLFDSPVLCWSVWLWDTSHPPYSICAQLFPLIKSLNNLTYMKRNKSVFSFIVLALYIFSLFLTFILFLRVRKQGVECRRLCVCDRESCTERHTERLCKGVQYTQSLPNIKNTFLIWNTFLIMSCPTPL
jgi:hypothetical protein